MPAGRVAGEVTRAALISAHVGTGRAASASARMQSAYLFANGVLSSSACVVAAIWLGRTNILTLLLAGNAVMMFVLSTALLAILWNGRVGRWLDGVRRRFVKVSEAPPALETPEERKVPWQSAIVATTGRASQTLQYGIILHAVGGAASIHGAFLAHGIHLVGATAGDMIPNQLGVVDGVYRTFAHPLGFGGIGRLRGALDRGGRPHHAAPVLQRVRPRRGGDEDPETDDARARVTGAPARSLCEQQLEHPGVHVTVRGHDVPGRDHVAFARGIGRAASGLTHEQRARGHVPR